MHALVDLDSGDELGEWLRALARVEVVRVLNEEVDVGSGSTMTCVRMASMLGRTRALSALVDVIVELVVEDAVVGLSDRLVEDALHAAVTSSACRPSSPDSWLDALRTLLTHARPSPAVVSSLVVSAAGQRQADALHVIFQNAPTADANCSNGAPLLHAVSVLPGAEAVVELLLRKGADPNAYDRSMGYPLVRAATMNCVAIVRALLDGGADPDVHHACLPAMPLGPSPVRNASNELTTPLMHATMRGHLYCVLLLLQHNCDLTRVDTSGKTALDLAHQFSREAIAEAIQQHDRRTKIALLLVGVRLALPNTSLSNLGRHSLFDANVMRLISALL